MKKNLFKALLFVSVIALLAGCSKQTTGDTDTTTEPVANTNPVFTYAIPSDTGNTLNPLTADDRFGLMTTHLAFSPMYFLYPDGHIEYILADSFEASEDGLTYTLKLKEGLKWSDGQPITADDIIFTYQTHNDRSENLFIAGKPIELEKVDDLTVLFKLPAVSASVIETLSAEVSILPKHYFENRNSFDINMLEETVVGSGPYVLSEYKTGQYLKFDKNPNYSLGEPSIETIILKIIENNDTASLALQNGEVDVWVGVPDLLGPFEGNANYVINNYSEGRVAYLRLNPNTEAMKDKEYRKGILYALDRGDIMKAGYTDENFYKLSYSFLPPSNMYYTEDVEKWTQDIDKAKELTANGPKKVKICFIEDNSVITNQALIVQNQLANIGIEAELVGVNQAAYMSIAYDKTNTEYDIFFGGYVMGVDPEVFAPLFVSTTDNMIMYNNKEIDALFAKGNITLDQSERMEIYKEVQRLVSEEAIFYPFGSNLRTLVTSARVEGIEDAQLVPIYTFGDWGKLKLK